MATSDELANAFLRSKEMDETESYLNRGRRFAGLPIEVLNTDWAKAFRALVQGDHSRARDLDDLGAELRLRGMELPEHLVKSEIEKIAERIRREGIDGPGAEERRRQINQFLRDRDDKSH